jgi:hypothetical protein
VGRGALVVQAAGKSTDCGARTTFVGSGPGRNRTSARRFEVCRSIR